MNPTAPIGSPELAEFAGDVRASLTRQPRELPSKYFYDGLGSALFDAICHLPWYAVTRAERRLLSGEAGCAVANRYDTFVELGPGNGSKMLTLLSQRCPGASPSTIHFVDVSATALQLAARALEGVGRSQVVTHETSYEEGFARFARARGPAPALAMFLGSNIGNFAPAAARRFLRRLRSGLRSGDGFLLGADLIKSERRLLDAYDDPLGVTAAFNRNLLVCLQRELEAQIDIEAFEHRALWNPAECRVEMHLVSRWDQRVVIPGAGVDFVLAAGETIWTESSYKYEPDNLRDMLEGSGFEDATPWIDEADRFALVHAIVP